jgi:hypothetical protein
LCLSPLSTGQFVGRTLLGKNLTDAQPWQCHGRVLSMAKAPSDWVALVLWEGWSEQDGSCPAASLQDIT